MSRKVIFCVLCAALCAALAVIPASAVTTQCETNEGSNIGAQNYSTYAKPVRSYLVPTSDGGVMRVQAGGDIKGVLVEYYDASHNMITSKTKHIAEELPEFGAFYASDDAYYILTGQYNLDESPTTEVFRVTKYDKNWKRGLCAGLSDCNTTVPFDAGSARMEAYGNYLIVRTAHEMYMDEDGYNHQANITFEIDTRTMEVTDSFSEVMNQNWGYVSHSFNQFVHIDGGSIVAVDHGDAHPRSIVLIKYPSDVTTGKFVEWGCSATDILALEGEIGDNYTGASVGAFEMSDSSYLVAGNSVVQDANSHNRSTRNVFVASVGKSGGSVSVNWLTKYSEGDGTASTPHMVKTAQDSWLVLWERGGKVYYTSVNGKGQTSSKTYSLDGMLSDCAPVVSGGKVTWYTWDDGTITFYDINVSDISRTSVTEIKNGHRYELKSAKGGISTVRCSVCGAEKKVASATALHAYWSREEYGDYSSVMPDMLERGDVIYLWIMGSGVPNGAEPCGEWTVTVSDSSVVSFVPTTETVDDLSGRLTMLSPGRAEVTVSPKYNPDVKKTITVAVRCAVHGGADGKSFVTENARAATCTSLGYTGDKVCAVCGEIVERGSTTPKTDHKTERKNAKTATCTSQGYTGDLVCTVCGKTVEAGKTIPKTAHEYVNGVCVVCGAKKTSGEPPVTEPPSTTPGVTTSGVTEPNVTEPGVSEPVGTGTPSTAPPATGETAEPSTTEPGVTEPGVTEPGDTEPSATEPSDSGIGSSDSIAVTTPAQTVRDTDDDGGDRDPDVTATDEKPDGGDGGCGSVISVSAVMCALCAAVVCAAFRRKEQGKSE